MESDAMTKKVDLYRTEGIERRQRKREREAKAALHVTASQQDRERERVSVRAAERIAVCSLQSAHALVSFSLSLSFSLRRVEPRTCTYILKTSTTYIWRAYLHLCLVDRRAYGFASELFLPLGSLWLQCACITRATKQLCCTYYA